VVFLALTPCYPRPSVFVDPTHVKIMTEGTHIYFVGDQPIAAMYGFKRRFGIKELSWETPKNIRVSGVY
jgi:hypothetical protein